MGIKQKIWALPALTATIFVISVATILTVSFKTTDKIASLGNSSFPYLDAVTQMSAQMDPLVATYQRAVEEGETRRVDEAKLKAGAMTALVDRIAELPGRKESAEQLRTTLGAYVKSAEGTALILLQKAPGDPATAVPDMQAKLKAAKDILATDSTDARAEFDSTLAQGTNGVKSIGLVTLGSALAVIGILALSSWWIIGSVWNQLGAEPDYARGLMQDIAAGDLSGRIDARDMKRPNLLTAMKHMSDGLRDMVANVRDGSQQIAQAAKEIAAGNSDLSRRTEEQASAVKFTTTAMGHLTSSVASNAASAIRASELAEDARAVAERGGTVVLEVVEMMEHLSSTSRRVSEITSVIDGIAFQTNILALNAAVEAARAGEQGRGFAVVAGEVRNLAQRAAAAAKEIASLIGASVEEVERGTTLVGRAGATMKDVLASVKSVNTIINEISTASGDQNRRIGEVGHAISGIDSTTRQNGALVHEAANAAASLEQQTQRLATLAERFRLEPAAATAQTY